MALDTPTGMQAADDATELTFHYGYPTTWEQADPIAYGQGYVRNSEDPMGHRDWRKTRSDENAVLGGG